VESITADQGSITNLSVNSLLLNGQPLSISSNVSFTAAPGQISLTYTNITNLEIGLATYGTASTCPWPSVSTDAFGRSLISCNTPPLASVSVGNQLVLSGNSTNPVISLPANVSFSYFQAISGTFVGDLYVAGNIYSGQTPLPRPMATSISIHNMLFATLSDMLPGICFTLITALLYIRMQKQRGKVVDIEMCSKDGAVGVTPASGNATVKGALAVGSAALANAGDISWSGALVGNSDTASVYPASVTARLLKEKLAESVSVKDYGALGNGIADDSAAFAAALAASASKTLHVPSGTYLILTAGFALPSNCTIVGGGLQSTTLAYRPTLGSYREFFVVASNTNNIVIANLAITCTPLDATSQFVVFAMRGNASGLALFRVKIDGGITVSGSTASNVTYGISFPNGSGLVVSNLATLQCQFTRISYLFLKISSSQSSTLNVSVINCAFSENTVEECSLNSPNGVLDNVLVEGNSFDNNIGYQILPSNTSMAIGFAGGNNVRVIGNRIRGSYVFNAIHLEDNVTNFVVADNVMEIQGYGITVQSASNTLSPSNGVINSNVAKCTGTTNIAAGAAYSVVFSGAYNSGNTQGRQIVWSSNVADGPFAVGFQAATRVGDGISFCDNEAIGCTTGFQFIGSANTNYNNSAVLCGTGVGTVLGGGGRSQSFTSCTTNFATSGGGDTPGVLNGAIFYIPPLTVSAGNNDIVLLKLASTDRLSVSVCIKSARTIVTASYTENLYTLLWDGTTFTSTTVFQLQPGSIQTSLVRTGGNLVLRIFAGVGVTLVTCECVLDGYYCCA